MPRDCESGYRPYFPSRVLEALTVEETADGEIKRGAIAEGVAWTLDFGGGIPFGGLLRDVKDFREQRGSNFVAADRFELSASIFFAPMR